MAIYSQVDRIERKLSTVAARYAVGPVTTVAADFLRGGAPAFARVYDRRGARIGALQRGVDEPWAVFRGRAREEALKLPKARSVVIGGLPDDVAEIEEGATDWCDSDPPRGAIVLPETALHPSQVQALRLIRRHRRVSLICGRRWGKSSILITLAVDGALCGQRIGVFCPTRTLMSSLLREIALALRGVRGVSINSVLGEIRLPNGGHVDFWSVDHTGRAGRGRKYHRVLIDKSAHDETYLTSAFSAAITPTLLDYAGSIVEASTPNEIDPTNHFWQTAHDESLGFVTFHAPTSANPFLPPEEIVALRLTMRAEVASQELDALFVDMAGVSIFPLAALLENGQPVADDRPIDTTGVAINSAAGETGFEHDGTAAVIYGRASLAPLATLSHDDLGLGRAFSCTWRCGRVAQARQRPLSLVGCARPTAAGAEAGGK